MCDDYDDMGVQGFSCSEQRRAKKTHACEECWRDILPGESYLHCAGLWEGEISTHKLCGFCEKLGIAHSRAERALGHSGSYQIGTLPHQVASCAQEEPRYADFFRRAWRGETLPRFDYAAEWRATLSDTVVSGSRL